MATAASKRKSKNRLPLSWGVLPVSIDVLYITGPQRAGAWLAEAFACDNATEVHLEEASSMAAGLARLRDDIFDAVLIGHCPGQLDALELLDAMQTAGCDEQAILVLGSQSEQEMADLCFEAGADAYLCVNTTTTRTLIWHVARASERRRLIAENRRLNRSRQHRLELEHDEANRLLGQQREMIEGLERLQQDRAADAVSFGSGTGATAALPERLLSHYRELLRAYVIMSSGNLNREMHCLADMLASASVSAQQAMMMHLQVLEEMIEGLGCRSARHVINRADLLILEMMSNLVQSYRERLDRYQRPPRQQWLDGINPEEYLVSPADFDHNKGK